MANEHDGHRGRLIAKIEKGALEEHEWLEMLLFNALPRRNTNPLAHKLLSVFGSIEKIFAASVSQLTAVDGIGVGIASYLKCIGKFYEYYRPSGGFAYPSHFEANTFLEYLVREYAHRPTELFDIYLLDKHADVIYRKRFEEHSESRVSVAASELAETIALNKPSGVIIVHNHPKARCQPSKEDDDTTKKIAVLCSAHDVLLCDHYIVGFKKDVYSYRAAGEMAHISKEYSVNTILSNTEKFQEATKRQRAETQEKANEARLSKMPSLRDFDCAYEENFEEPYSSDDELPF